MDKKNTYNVYPNPDRASTRHLCVHPPTVIHTKIGSRIALLLHFALRVLVPRTQLATSRSDPPLDLSLDLLETLTRPDHLLLDLLNP